jgi:predicted RND superfamily exporter protein
VSGRAIVINVLSVALGFLVLTFSNLVPLQRFGLLVAVTMIISGAAALTLLPATLTLFSKFKVK